MSPSPLPAGRQADPLPQGAREVPLIPAIEK